MVETQIGNCRAGYMWCNQSYVKIHHSKEEGKYMCGNCGGTWDEEKEARMKRQEAHPHIQPRRSETEEDPRESAYDDPEVSSFGIKDDAATLRAVEHSIGN